MRDGSVGGECPGVTDTWVGFVVMRVCDGLEVVDVALEGEDSTCIDGRGPFDVVVLYGVVDFADAVEEEAVEVVDVGVEEKEESD